jgi:hypothetical protein
MSDAGDNVVVLHRDVLTLEQIDEHRARARQRYEEAAAVGDDVGRLRALYQINEWRIARARFISAVRRHAS